MPRCGRTLIGGAAAFLSVALAACGGNDEPSASHTGGAGGQAGSTGTGGSGGSTSPSCRGIEIPAGDLTPDSDGRSVTVSCSAVTLRATVVDSAIIRLRYEGSTPAAGRASYAVVDQPAPAVAPLFGSTADRVLVCTDDLLIEIDRQSCHVTATDAGGKVVLEDPDTGGYFEGGPLASGLTHTAAPGEHFYGFGERTGPLDKRGTKLTFWNTDAYQAAYGGYPPDADPLYQSIPFFVGLRGDVAYGVFLDDTRRLEFDVAASDASRYTLSSAGNGLDEYLIAGPKMRDVVRRYTWLTGRAPLPPRWALGYHQSRWGYSPDSQVLAIAQELRARKLPADGIWLDIQHMDGFRSFTWDPVTFPDPKGLVSSLSSLGFETVSIVDPGIKVDPSWDVYQTALAKSYFVTLNGSPYEGEVWPGAASFPDFSSPEVRAWWGTLLPRELDAGVRGLWIDMNEPSNFLTQAGGTVPEDAMCAGDGIPGTMAELHNVYGANEARATWEGMRAARPGERPFVLTRAGYAGVQRHAAVWTGDAPSTWETLDVTLPMLLGMGLSGLGFVGSDVGGYSGGASAELFARWMQLGSFSPFFRAHVTTGVAGQEPWAFGYEVTDISRNAMNARYELMPYLYSLFRENSQTGAPILRPLVYEFQADPAVANLADEAMLGPWLLFAPVLEQGATDRAVTLPAGRWFEYRSGAIHDGPGMFTTSVTLGALPTFVRAGAIIPRMQRVQYTSEAPIQTLYLDLYPDSTASSFVLYEDDGVSFGHEKGSYSEVSYGLARTASGATLTAGDRVGSFVPPARQLVARIRRVDHAPSGAKLDGKPLVAFSDYDSLVAAGEGWFYDDRDLSLVVAFSDRVGYQLDLEYDPSISELSPPVLMPFSVTVPAGTPTTTPIHIATSASGWTGQPLGWSTDQKSASGLVSVPRGEYVFYKYTRGDWATVEKLPGCVEANNRYELGAAHPLKEDTVYAWADSCP